MKYLFQIIFVSVLTTACVQIGQAAVKSNQRSTLSNPPRLEFSSVQLKTGVRLRYAQQGNPSGQPVILLHGYTDSWFSYSMVLPLLDPKYRVFVLDQRGHGESDRPSRGYSLPHFAADVIAFMDVKGLRRATIVGHSMGSIVAQHVASRAPHRVNRLVLVASVATVRNEVVLGLSREITALPDNVPEKFVRDFQLSTIFKPLPDEFLDRVIKESLKVPARVWKEVMAGMLAPEANADLTKLKMPTLVLWGDRETIFGRSEQDSLMSALPNAVFKIYPETGHALHWERPTDFAKDLQGFIE